MKLLLKCQSTGKYVSKSDTLTELVSDAKIFEPTLRHELVNILWDYNKKFNTNFKTILES
jgi:hypothetical protein